MSQEQMMAKMSSHDGFIAALDQSGGSTPGALRLYGIPDNAYSGDDEMYRLVHEMRVRIITAPPFNGDKVIGAILFERTMDGQANGKPVPSYLWNDKHVVPFLKIDKGLEAEADGVQMLKPISGRDALLERARKLGVFGTKERSVIHQPSKTGIAAIVAQQFELGAQVCNHGLVPIIEPEVNIKSADKAGCEAILAEELIKHADKVPAGQKVMLKLTIPTKPDLFLPLTKHPKIARVVALSGGYSRADACAKLAENHGMIASFSRAFAEGLTKQMSDAEFNAAIAASIDAIFKASSVKH